MRLFLLSSPRGHSTVCPNDPKKLQIIHIYEAEIRRFWLKSQTSKKIEKLQSINKLLKRLNMTEFKVSQSEKEALDKLNQKCLV